VSKFSINLSYKNCCILKHALRDKVNENESSYKFLKSLKVEELTDEGRKYIKECEEEKRALTAITEEIYQAKARNWHMH